MRSDVTLRPLDRPLLVELLGTAIDDADPGEVMPPVAGPAGWTPERRAAFLRFHQARSLAAEPAEATFAIVVGGTVVGAARLCPLQEAARSVEAGVWIGRSHRGIGVGRAVLEQLIDRARADGFDQLFIRTTPDNTAVHRLLTGLGVDPVREGDSVTARVRLTALDPEGRHVRIF